MSTDPTDLEPIEPRTAQKLYLDHKASQYSVKTVRAHRYRTNHFIEWCDIEDIDNMNDLTGRSIQRYRLWRQDTGDLAKITLNQQMSTIRVFLKWAGSIEAVAANLYDKVMVPRVTPEEERRDETLSTEEASTILDYLSTYHYASVEHAVFAVLWETGMRLGGANSLDVGDVHVDEEAIELVHRPDRGTQLKNGANGERPVAITTSLAGLLEQYVENTRVDATDESGREPLFTSSYGRLSKSSLRRYVYQVTAPCFRNEPCPDCSGCDEPRCAEAVSPHAIRRGSITHALTEDVPVEVIGDRMNVSRDVIDKHYDKRSEEVKLEQRRGYLDNI
ncbi:tyrosine-type recombinase/integrase [Halosimplex sp. TS25]|uniref:tyrosine-type recombinase/integrase n=1 Tax=Halosimplex rarum TaxID=3396619 RepID=UPI0039E94FF2